MWLTYLWPIYVHKINGSLLVTGLVFDPGKVLPKKCTLEFLMQKLVLTDPVLWDSFKSSGDS